MHRWTFEPCSSFFLMLSNVPSPASRRTIEDQQAHPLDDRLNALANVAARWRDPEYGPRAHAVDATLEAPNRWTEEALAHVLNRRMQSITVDALDTWLGPAGGGRPRTVAVGFGAAGPLDGFRMALAAWGLGHSTIGVVPEASPALIPAFAEDLEREEPALEAQFAGWDDALSAGDCVMARPEGSDEHERIRKACDRHEIPTSQRLLQGPVYSVGWVDGHETDDERERLAEDMLLLDGTGRRRLAILWAPAGLAPDAYLESMAHFRGLYPAHDDTPGTLQMQQAFLEAQDQSHAYAEDLQFLVSRGEPSPQSSAHIRWVEYDDREEMERWLSDHAEEVYALIARQHIHDQVDPDCRLRTPSGVHVPSLRDPEGQAIREFLESAG
ncbi:MAG: hypothetical protein ACLFTE_09020 [Salinivenus sp.]